MILAKSRGKLRSLKNYLGLALSVRATISDSKADFHKEFPYVIPPIYRKLADELLVELHLLSHQKTFKNGAIFATGLKELFNESVDINYLVFLAVVSSFTFSFLTVKFFLDYINRFSMNAFVIYRILIALILFYLIY